jgi:hypothetical protein
MSHHKSLLFNDLQRGAGSLSLREVLEASTVGAFGFYAPKKCAKLAVGFSIKI